MTEKFIADGAPFLHGCDYNPEQWIAYPDILPLDMEYMKKAHCNVVSLGIFSWALLEPEEGKYDFTYFDKVVESLTANDIKIILATPSAGRPRWLAEKYPEVMRVGKNRQRNLYGVRANHCPTSPVFREKVANIDRRLAERYKDNKNIILWHISNEFSGECHCDLCQQAFREWLKKKYHNDLDALNHAWWARFWSHDVTDWQQIHSPVFGGETDRDMPGLYADWKHFVSDQTTDFMRHEIAVVKSVTPDIPATTNFTGPYNYFLDFHDMKDYVDVVAWDSYPEWHSARGNEIEAYSIAFTHDMNRCHLQKPFLLLESTPSMTNWLDYNKLKRPGMHKLSSLQAVAHGSDSVMYFQWRKGRGGCEKFHGAVIDHNGKAGGRVFDDVRDVGVTLEKLQEITGSMPDAKVAVVYEFKNRWLLDNALGFQLRDKKYKRTCINHYKEFWKRGIDVDVISARSDLSGYDVVILPMLYSISEEDVERIRRYVAEGGTVIGTYATGYVDENDLCYLGGFPGGKMKEVFGLTADEIDSLFPGDKNRVTLVKEAFGVSGDEESAGACSEDSGEQADKAGRDNICRADACDEAGGECGRRPAAWGHKEYTAVDYCELITPEGAEVLGTYGEDFYQGYPAVLKNQYGKGTAYYIGFRDTGEFLSDFYEDIIAQKGLGGYKLPEGVTIHSRQNQEYVYLFVENYGSQTKEVALPGEYQDMETGEKICGSVAVEGFGIRILKTGMNR